MQFLFIFWTTTISLLFPVLTEEKPDDFDAYQFTIKEGIEPISMVPIQGGQLDLSKNGLEPASISDFWIGQFEITWDQYDAYVYGEIDQKTYNQGNLDNLRIDGISGATIPYQDMTKGMGKGKFPAINMTQYAALKFCQWLSAMTGEFYRLPTEAEWEYACRMGEAGLENENPMKYVIFDRNSNFAYKEVGSLNADNAGLYDMKGNVAEWTMDQYIDNFYAEISGKTDPWTKPVQLYPKLVKGGSWREDDRSCQCSSRRASKPTWKKMDPQIPKSKWWHTNADYVGFRIVRPKERPSSEEISNFWLEPIEDF